MNAKLIQGQVFQTLWKGGLIGTLPPEGLI